MRKNMIAYVPFYLLTVIILLGIAHLGSRSVTVFSQLKPIPRKYVFVIDAGHGGEDGGATSCSGVLESAINLEIALKLDELMHFLGYETIMIRSTDKSIYTEGTSIAQKKISDLKERVRIVNETENAILISIHQNTFSDSRYGGAQVFYADSDQSIKLANILQSQLKAVLNPNSNRQHKKAQGVYLMEQIQTPGILIECGFLSNPEEEAKLRSDSYQKKICCVIVCSISEFLNQ